MIYLKDSSSNVYSFYGHVVYRQNVSGYGYHIPFSAVNFASSLGLELQEIEVVYYGDRGDFNFDDIVEFSTDNSTWQKVYYMSGVNWESVPSGFKTAFIISYIVSPLRLGASHSSGTKWGLTSTSLTTSGNRTAYAKITYQAPRYYFPLAQNLVDFAGASISFTSTGEKTRRGVVYPANTPIFDEGLYLGNEFNDEAKFTFANLTAHTIIAQIKSTRYPSDWVAGGSEGNMLTANQSNAETSTEGMTGGGGTFSRTTTAGEYYAGNAGFKVVSTATDDIYICPSDRLSTGITAGKYYCFSVYAKSSNTSKNWYVRINWYDASHALISYSTTTIQPSSATWTRLFVIGKAPENTVECLPLVLVQSASVEDALYVDNLMFERLNDENLTVWDDGVKNKLYIDVPNGLLKWTDYTSAVSCTFPVEYFFQENSSYSRKKITIVAVHNGTTKELHCKYEGGSFYDGSGTLNDLSWSNEITLGRFDGSLANLVQYPYVLTSSEYNNLNFASEPLRFNDFYIANITPGTIVYDEGKLTDENGNEITGLYSGVPVEEGTIEFKEGLSARWSVEAQDTYFP